MTDTPYDGEPERPDPATTDNPYDGKPERPDPVVTVGPDGPTTTEPEPEPLIDSEQATRLFLAERAAEMLRARSGPFSARPALDPADVVMLTDYLVNGAGKSTSFADFMKEVFEDDGTDGTDLPTGYPGSAGDDQPRDGDVEAMIKVKVRDLQIGDRLPTWRAVVTDTPIASGRVDVLEVPVRWDPDIDVEDVDPAVLYLGRDRDVDVVRTGNREGV